MIPIRTDSVSNSPTPLPLESRTPVLLQRNIGSCPVVRSGRLRRKCRRRPGAAFFSKPFTASSGYSIGGKVLITDINGSPTRSGIPVAIVARSFQPRIDHARIQLVGCRHPGTIPRISPAGEWILLQWQELVGTHRIKREWRQKAEPAFQKPAPPGTGLFVDRANAVLPSGGNRGSE